MLQCEEITPSGLFNPVCLCVFFTARWYVCALCVALKCHISPIIKVSKVLSFQSSDKTSSAQEM